MISLFVLSLAAFVFTGCGEKLPDGMPKLYPTLITVIQEGEPCEGALVQLFPEDSTLSQWGASAVSDAKGVAEMLTNAKYKGAPLGKYKVTVMKREREPHPNPEWANLPREDPNFQKFVQIANDLKLYDYVQPQFSSEVKSPLQIEVTAGQKEHKIDVGQKIKTEIVTLQSRGI